MRRGSRKNAQVEFSPWRSTRSVASYTALVHVTSIFVLDIEERIYAQLSSTRSSNKRQICLSFERS
jgi:hypothetical protein